MLYNRSLLLIVVVQSPSRVWLFVTPWTTAYLVFLSLAISWSLPKLMSIASVMPSSHLILWCPLLLLPSIFPSIRDFSNESTVGIRWPKYWSFNFSISPSNEYSGPISFKTDWLDLLAVQGTLGSLLQHHSWKASMLLALCLLYGPALTTVRDHWEDHSFDYMDLCQQFLCFSTHCVCLSSLSCQEAIVFWFHGWLQSPSQWWYIFYPSKQNKDLEWAQLQ